LFRTVCFAKSCYTKLPKISSEDKYFLKILWVGIDGNLLRFD
jgi:hypothetical protein